MIRAGPLFWPTKWWPFFRPVCRAFGCGSSPKEPRIGFRRGSSAFCNRSSTVVRPRMCHPCPHSTTTPSTGPAVNYTRCPWRPSRARLPHPPLPPPPITISISISSRDNFQTSTSRLETRIFQFHLFKSQSEEALFIQPISVNRHLVSHFSKFHSMTYRWTFQFSKNLFSPIWSKHLTADPVLF